VKELVVLSGKGGTGKTSVVASFAALAQKKVLVDCDVDAADLYLLLRPDEEEKQDFWSGQVASIDRERCTQCGLCQKLCRFGAIKEYSVDTIVCEGCGFCYQLCPVGAITMKENLAGYWFMANTKYGYLSHARLRAAQENSGKLVALVRENARVLAQEEGLELIISDGPPGTGCPVISSLSGVDLALLVTEPTLSGIHDLTRIVDVCRRFGVPALVCINKYNISEENTRENENYCSEEEIKVAAKIPFDNVVTEALVARMPVIEYRDGQIAREIKNLWRFVLETLK
jgi:MinD superfamily P-loop ATPase